MSDELDKYPAQLFLHDGADSTPIDLRAYLNRAGLITIQLTDETWIQVSPLVAKEFIEH